MIVPCVVNWKADHYAALTREDHGLFQASDPTFGSDILVSKAALDAERVISEFDRKLPRTNTN